MAAVFFHNDEQKRLALETKDREAEKRQDRIQTEILPFSGFYLAEDYHQKHYLRNSDFFEVLNTIYPEAGDFTNSTAAARVNGYLAGLGTVRALKKELKSLGLSPEREEELTNIVQSLRQ
jgi:peptide-methionine (S)-S-oxide reductase